MVELDQEYVDSIFPEILRRVPENPLLFLNSLKIPSASGPQYYKNCMADFQKDTFSALAPSLLAVSKYKMPPIRRFWIERTKKSSKDGDVAACLIWLMAFSPRPLKVQISASNRRQAAIIRNRAIEIIHYNPWLREHVEIVRSGMRNMSRPNEVWTHIEATDSTGGAHGETPDVLVLNELVHVAKWRAMDDHMANADGVPQGIVIVATNAGIKGTKAWLWRQNAISSNRWFTNIRSEIAPWIDPQDVEEAKKRDPIGAEFARLWQGRWISGAGNAVTDEEVESCFVLNGPTDGPETGWLYFGGLDLGVKKDHAGVAIVGVNRRLQLARIACLRGFEPVMLDDGSMEVDSEEVERYCEEMGKKFRVPWFGYDPAAGGSFMAQRLRKAGLRMVEVSFASSVKQTEMAVAFVQLIKQGRLQCFEDGEGRLRRDFSKFDIEHKLPNNYKRVAVSDEYGHADVGVSVVITLPRIIREIGEWDRLSPDDGIAFCDIDDEWGKWTDDDTDTLPDDLRSIYELSGGGEETDI